MSSSEDEGEDEEEAVVLLNLIDGHKPLSVVLSAQNVYGLANRKRHVFDFIVHYDRHHRRADGADNRE